MSTHTTRFRQRVLNGLTEVIARDGTASITRVAEETGLSRSTVHYHLHRAIDEGLIAPPKEPGRAWVWEYVGGGDVDRDVTPLRKLITATADDYAARHDHVVVLDDIVAEEIAQAVADQYGIEP